MSTTKQFNNKNEISSSKESKNNVNNNINHNHYYDLESVSDQHISIKSLNEDDDITLSSFESIELPENWKSGDNNNILTKSEQEIISSTSNKPITSQEFQTDNSLKINNLDIQSSTDVTIGTKYVYNQPIIINKLVKNNDTHNQEPKENVEHEIKTDKNQFGIFRICNTLTKSPKKKKVLILLILLVIIIIGSILGYFLSTKSGNSYLVKNIRIVKRDEWKADPPKEELDPFVIKPFRALIAHTDTAACFTESSCRSRVKLIQKIMQAKYDDIGYNFLVGGDGLVYEGCGWDKIGIHTIGYNNNSICIGFIGNFITYPPNEKQLAAGQWILEECVKNGKLTEDYKLYGVGQVVPSDSPGVQLQNIIQKWPHWTDEV